MMKTNLKKRVLTAIMAAIGFVLSTFVYIPNMAPFQHFVNVICAVLLGPWYAFLAALLTGILRMVLTGRTILAIVGAVIGAALAGILYKVTGKMIMAVIGEIIGTGIISAMVAAPIMKYGFGMEVVDSAIYYIPFFLPACVVGAILGYVVLLILKKAGTLEHIQKLLK